MQIGTKVIIKNKTLVDAFIPNCFHIGLGKDFEVVHSVSNSIVVANKDSVSAWISEIDVLPLSKSLLHKLKEQV